MESKPVNNRSLHRGQYDRGYLPHIDRPDLVQFITYRLADSLPKHLREAADDEFDALDSELDRGLGSCVLQRPEIARVVLDNWRHFNGQRYTILAACVMPNHVHVLIEPVTGYALAKVVQGWKSYTAKEINKLIDSSGELWQSSYFDRYIRDDAHLRKTSEYIVNNPVSAGLVNHPDDWPFTIVQGSRL